MLKLFKHLSGRDLFFTFFALVSIVFQVWMDLTLPDYMAEITVLVETPGSTMAEIISAGGKMLAAAFGSFLASISTVGFAAKIASDFGAKLRDKVFNKVLTFSLSEISSFSTSSLITRQTNDITQIQVLIVMGLQMLVKAPIMASFAVAKVFGKRWQWTLATGIDVLFLVVVVGFCIGLALPKFKKLQHLTDEINRVSRENLTGLKVVRAYNAIPYQSRKFERINSAFTSTNLFSMRALAFLVPTIQLSMNALTLSIYWIGAGLISQSNFQERLSLFSDMIVFSQYAVMVISAFMMLVVVFMMLPRASISARRINEVLETGSSIIDGSETTGSDDNAPAIEFRHVSFRYPDAKENVLDDISFRAEEGETVAFLGSTGSGKSTVVNLIPRFYDVSSGEVLVNGVNVKAYTQQALRSKIGFVSQKATLFSGTIRSNVAYGDNGRSVADTKTVRAALETAQAEDFVKAGELGLDAFVSQGGANMSGGQKQRISIARAFYRDPEIFIFDDAFSALDYKTDRDLRGALKRGYKSATKLIVAQRIGTIRDADKIIVLDEGRIVGVGKHQDLLKSCEVYHQIALSQLSEEELA